MVGGGVSLPLFGSITAIFFCLSTKMWTMSVKKIWGKKGKNENTKR